MITSIRTAWILKLAALDCVFQSTDLGMMPCRIVRDYQVDRPKKKMRSIHEGCGCMAKNMKRQRHTEVPAHLLKQVLTIR